MSTVLKVDGLTKRFADRYALSGVSFEIAAGEFVALLGPNGSGKSTLIKILDGVHRADAGRVELASGGRVGVVHQDLGLVDDLSVVENLRLGSQPHRSPVGLLNTFAERRAAKEALHRLGLHIPLSTLVGHLTPPEKALLAVARLVQRKAQVVVLDEITSTLSAQDSARLIDTLRAASLEDVSIIMVSHKLDEVLAYSDRLLVLIDGELVLDQRRPLPDVAGLTAILARRDRPSFSARPTAEPDAGSTPLLELDAVTLRGLGPINLQVHAGQCVAVTGRVGSRIEHLALIAAGLLRPDSGRVRRAPGEVAFVAPQRETQGNFVDLPVCWNMSLSALRRWRRFGGPFLSTAKERRDVEEKARQLNVQPPGAVGLPQYALSGGNQQKVLFGRALLLESDVYVLCEPTRGVDVATRYALYELMDRLKAEGAALLVVTSDPDDVLAISDRVAVLVEGRLAHEWSSRDLTRELLTAAV